MAFTRAEIGRIILIAEDAVGPPIRHLLVRSRDGEEAWFEGRRSQRRVIEELRKTWPEMAEVVEDHLFVCELPANVEVTLFAAPD